MIFLQVDIQNLTRMSNLWFEVGNLNKISRKGQIMNRQESALPSSVKISEKCTRRVLIIGAARPHSLFKITMLCLLGIQP